MAKTYSAGGVAHGAKYWRLTIDVKESGGERRRLTKTTKIACAKNSARGRSAALTALRQWRDELIRQAEAEDSVGSGTPTADYAEDFIARHSEVAPATREEYMRAVRDMRLARIDEAPISMLKPSDVQDWMIWLRDERGLGPASRNKKARRAGYGLQVRRRDRGRPHRRHRPAQGAQGPSEAGQLPYGVKPGDEVVFAGDASTRATVIDERHVEYEGVTTSLSALAEQLTGLGHAPQGPLYFSYEGELLTERRDRMELIGGERPCC